MGDVYRADFSNRTWTFDVNASTVLFGDIIPDDICERIRGSGTKLQQLQLGRLAENLEVILIANEGLLSAETRGFFLTELSSILSGQDFETDPCREEEGRGNS